ncbi:MAG: alpha/beta hydrolase [Sediminibacterium sp.]
MNRITKQKEPVLLLDFLPAEEMRAESSCRDNFTSMLIYKQYTQDSLDRQYNNRLNVPDHEIHLQRWESLSREAEKRYPVKKNISYGELPDEKLDIFPSAQPNSKTLVFIHGGYWYKHAAVDFYLIAEAFRSYGFTTVLIDYPLMPAHTMEQVIISCRKAIHWLQRNQFEYNGDPAQIYISGHSAGGHLAAMMMVENEPSFPYPIKGVCAISGLYNLLPVQLCYVNEVLGMDKETALTHSPVNLLPVVLCPMLLAVGANETKEYLEQSLELYTAWSKQNVQIEILEIETADHFSILEMMIDESSDLHNALCRLMNIS